MVEYTEEIRGVPALQLYDAEECRFIIDEIKRSAAWIDAKVSERIRGGFNAATRVEARRASVLAPAAASAVKLAFDEKMESIVKPLVNRVWRTSLKQHAETHFVRYLPGNYYTPHSDTGVHRQDRYFTVVCYLNEDFAGGGTSFPKLNYTVRPRSGKAVIFPASYMHSAEPVTRGEKFILVSWLLGQPPVRWLNP
jgi:predicted 2-oxoglutarate/Fe(II)-dependent dioxygenase YbiX